MNSVPIRSLQDTIDTFRIATHAVLISSLGCVEEPVKKPFIRRFCLNIFFFLSVFLSWSHPSALASSEESNQEFVVTAYYSPLPDQQYYLRGDFEAEKKLNGNGTHGASGKPVYFGMIAAPKTYPFGTKIYFEWLGVFTVDDRGWAITSSGSNPYQADRIDIWLGSWDEGLKRALLWWKRRVQWRVILPSEIDNYSKISMETFSKGKIDFSKFSSAVNLNAVSNSNSNDTKRAQELLTLFGYYNGNIDGKDSSSLKDSIFQFQKDTKILSAWSDKWAWNYWPKTKARLEQMYLEYSKARDVELQRIQKEQQNWTEEHLSWTSKTNQVKTYIASFGNPKKWEKGNHVRELQRTLKKLGYFSENDTGIFGNKTAESLLAYKKVNKLPITSELLDQKTKEHLMIDLLSL